MSTKILERAETKATTTVDQQRQIEFYMLAFQPTPDKQGDIIAPDAADEWLAKFYQQGFPLPVSFTHAAVRDSTDPFAIVGYAPADPEHVFKDEHGIRVRAFLDTGANETAQQVYMLTKRGIVSGASVAYIAEKETLQRDGSTLIQKMSILEAGPCLDPANDEAFVISVKAHDEIQALRRRMETEMKAVDESGWDGNRAMSSCSSAADYRSICAGEKSEGDPDERQHWALPHHYLGRGPNADGVRAALSRLPQTEGLTNKSGAQSHLEAHMSSISPAKAGPDVTVSLSLAEWEDLNEKAGRKLSAATEAKLNQARSLIDELLALVKEASSLDSEGKANEEEPEEANSEEPSPNADLREALAAI